MAFDDIPEDREPSFPCAEYDPEGEDSLCSGDITKFAGRWQCDVCGYDYGGDTLKEPDTGEL